ncbi:MAG: potassium transporter TrkG [Endomicrobiaceae bacterium]
MNSSPLRTIILFFIALIIFGTVLLCLPFSRQDDTVLSVLTSLFTATSAVCVTGLSVVNIGEYYSFFGQCVILLLIQLGGLGYMLVSTSLGLLLGKMALKDRKIMQELFDINSFNELFKLLKKAVLVVFGIEFIGALVLTFLFMKTFPFGRSVYLGIFHSVSAFCNAGFSPFVNSLEGFSQSPAVLYTMAAIIILGGLGFFVLVDIIDNIRGKNIRLTFHSKVTLWMTFVLIVSGFLAFALSEFLPLLEQNKSMWYIINNSFFQTVSVRTAGFNSISSVVMTNFAAFVIIILMFIGAGSGSTAGGVKISTVTLAVVFLKSVLRGKTSYPFAGRDMDSDLVRKSLAVFILMVLFILICIVGLLWTEPNIEPMKIVFESVSACCTVGISLGITSGISDLGRVVLILAMFIGRVGTVTILIYLMSGNFVKSNIKYPEAKLLIG